MMSYTWNQTAVENQCLYDGHDYDQSNVRRMPSPESVSSLAYSAFNFDDLKSNIDEVSKEGISEQRHPVQHPSGNENQTFDQDAHDTAERKAVSSNVNGSRRFHPAPDDDDSYNSITVSDDGIESIANFSNHRNYNVPPNAIQPIPGLYHQRFEVPPHPIGDQYPRYYTQNYPPMTQPGMMHPQTHPGMLLQQQQQQQQPYLRNGYSSGATSIGLKESLSNISGPDPIDNPDYRRENSKESVSSTSAFFVTMDPPYSDNGPSQTHMNTISGNMNNRTTQAYSTPVPPQPPPAAPEKVKVFVTYAQESQNSDHIRTVVQISQTLFKNSIEVTVDVLEETIRSTSISDWLESNIATSHFVLICVSPSYRQVVDGQSSSYAPQNENAINTQYIYRRIHAEYISQGSKNYRFIPVLVSGAQVQHIPAWLRDTKVFEWPKDYEDIIYRLFRQERFVKPKVGQPPKHTIERYNSLNSRKSSQPQESDHPGQTRPKQM